jgi:hypothetical protein
MAAPGTPYNKARLKLAQAGINLSTADVRALVVSSTYTPNYDTHEFLSSVTSAELTTNGAARVALANKIRSRSARRPAAPSRLAG